MLLSVLNCCYCFNEPDNGISFGQIFLEFLGAFLGFLFALLIYYFQIQRDKEKERIKEKENKKNQLKYYISLIDNNLKHFNRQTELSKKYGEDQRKNLLDLQVMGQVFTNDYERIKIIDNRGVFEAFGEFVKDPDWISKYNELSRALDLIEGLDGEMKRIFKVNAEKAYNDLLRIRDILDFIPDRLSSIAMQMALEMGDKRWESENYRFVDSSIKQYRKLADEKASMETFNSEFLEPLLRSLVEEYYHLSFAEEIMTYCKKARVLMNAVRHDVEHSVSEIEKIITNSELPIRKIIEIKADIVASIR